MRISVRLIVSLVAAITLVSLLFAAYQVRAETRSKRDELDHRAQVLAESLREAIDLLPQEGSEQKLRQIAARFGNRELLAGIAIYSSDGKPVIATSDPALRLAERLPPLDKSIILQGRSRGDFFRFGETEMHVYAVPLRSRQIGKKLHGCVWHCACFISRGEAI